MFSAASSIARRTGLQAQRRIMVSKPFQQLRLRKTFTSESGLGGGKGTENVPTSNINIFGIIISIADNKFRNVNKYVVATATAIIGAVVFAGTSDASTHPEVESCEDFVEEKGRTTHE